MRNHQLKTTESGYQSRVRNNSFRLYCWSGAWVAARALMGKEISGHKALVFTLSAVGLDIAAGVGVIAGIPFAMMSAFRIIPIHANIGHLVILQSLMFIVSLLYGDRRYR